MKMNLANKLTVFRMILVPLIAIVPVIDSLMGGIPGEFLGVSTAFLIMDAIFIIASITDKLDGYIARSRNQVTTFGKFLDPLADKILVLAALVILVEYSKIPSWVPIIVLAREFIVSGYRLLAVEKGGKVVAASIWGKLKTATQMVAIALIFIDKYNFTDCFNKVELGMSNGAFALNIITTLLLTVSIIATIFSGIDYLKDGKEYLKDA